MGSRVSRYHFYINYCQEKANKAAYALTYFPHQIIKKKLTFEQKLLKSFIISSFH